MQFRTISTENAARAAQAAVAARVGDLEQEYLANMAAIMRHGVELNRLNDVRSGLADGDPSIGTVEQAIERVKVDIRQFEANLGIIEQAHTEVCAVADSDDPAAALAEATSAAIAAAAPTPTETPDPAETPDPTETPDPAETPNPAETPTEG